MMDLNECLMMWFDNLIQTQRAEYLKDLSPMVDRWLYDVEKREFKKECTKGEGGALLEGL